MVYLHNGILLGRNKEVNFTLCDSMDGPGKHHTEINEISQSEKDKHRMIALIRGI